MTPLLLSCLLASQSFQLDRSVLDSVIAAEPGDDTTEDAEPPKKKKSTAPAAGPTPMPSAGSAATPQGKQFGLGLQLGYPTAIIIKYMLQPDQGIAAGLGGLSGFAYTVGGISLHVDYLWHPTLLASTDQFALTWYLGGGGNILLFNSGRYIPSFGWFPYYYTPTQLWLAARVPFGVDLALSQLPFDIFLEIVPSILIFPGIALGVNAAIGGRFWF